MSVIVTSLSLRSIKIVIYVSKDPLVDKKVRKTNSN